MWVGIFSSATILLPIIVGFIFLSKIDIFRKYFLGFLLFSLFFEIVTIYLAFQKINTLWLFRYFTIIDISFFFWLFQKKITIPRWLKILFALLLLYSIINVIYFKYQPSPQNYQNYFFVFGFLFSVILSGFIIIEIFDNLDLSPSRNSFFWIAFARLFYSLIILFIYVYPSIQSAGFENKSFLILFGILNATGNILCNIIYTYSFLCKRTIN